MALALKGPTLGDARDLSSEVVQAAAKLPRSWLAAILALLDERRQKQILRIDQGQAFDVDDACRHLDAIDRVTDELKKLEPDFPSPEKPKSYAGAPTEVAAVNLAKAVAPHGWRLTLEPLFRQMAENALLALRLDDEDDKLTRLDYQASRQEITTLLKMIEEAEASGKIAHEKLVKMERKMIANG